MIAKRISITIIVIIFLSICYVETSYLMYNRIVFPLLKPAVEKHDIMVTTEIEQAKHTDLAWLFWNQDSYIDYSWNNNDEYLNIKFASGLKITQAKIYWGIDGIYNNDFCGYELTSDFFNCIRVPDSSYNCARIYLLSPLTIYEQNGIENVETYIMIEEIAMSSGLLDAWKLYGGAIFLWILGVLWLNLYFHKDKWKICLPTFRYRKVFTFLFLWLFLFLIKEIYFKHNGISYFADAGQYYGAADTFILMNKFSFNNFLGGDSTFAFRGYFFPFLIFLFKLPGRIFPVLGVDLAYDVTSTAFISFFFAFILPSFFSLITHKNYSIVRMIFPAILTLLFVRGLVFYPLSDLYSAMFSVISITLFMKIMQEKRNSLKIIYSIVMGMSLYACYNIRAAFSIAIILVLINFCFAIPKNKYFVLTLLAALIGVSLSSFPQYIINKNLLDVDSIAVQTSKYYNQQDCREENLLTAQLLLGLGEYRYESDLSAGNPKFAVSYINREGMEIYNAVKSDTNNLLDFLLVLLKHPIFTLKNYLVHFFMVLDFRFPNIINANINNAIPLQALFSITFWTALGYYIVFGIKSKIKVIIKNISNSLGILAVLAPSIAQILGGFETRFAISLYILCFALLSYEYSKTNIQNTLKQKITFSIGSMVICLAVCIVNHYVYLKWR